MNDYDLYKECKSKYKALKKNKNQFTKLTDVLDNKITSYLVNCRCVFDSHDECFQCNGDGVTLGVPEGGGLVDLIDCDTCGGSGHYFSRTESEEYLNLSGTCEDKRKELVDAGKQNVVCTNMVQPLTSAQKWKLRLF